jgi:hypothetical protein
MPDASSNLIRTRYGTGNPERVENALWTLAMERDLTGSGLRRHLGLDLDDRRLQHRYWHSTYRDTAPGPFWSWRRFGRTTTLLPDGRRIHVAGEHEDSYDLDFCIYNDVVVEDPDGRVTFFLYPRDIFPPTDFHSATLVGRNIILIGSLGYSDLRRVGETQVLTLDTDTLRIDPVMTRGEGPGWISRHAVAEWSQGAIAVMGGKVQTPHAYEPYTGVFTLDLMTMTWSRQSGEGTQDW